MQLTVLDKNIPLRGIPEKQLNKVLITQFVPWLSKLLSLKDEVSADRLEMALPSIKERCIGMGFSEIVKMMEHYVDGKLPIEPRTNYFDRILFGKIVTEWKKYNKMKNKPQQPKMELSEKEIEEKENQILKRFMREYEFTQKVDDSDFYIYDILDKRGLMPTDIQYKNLIKEKAIKILEKEHSRVIAKSRDEKRDINNQIQKIKIGKSGLIEKKCKVLVLTDCLASLESKFMKYWNESQTSSGTKMIDSI